MNIDNYTKTILTIIALCLVVLTIKDLKFIPQATAEGGIKNNKNANLNYGLVPLNDDGSINVKLQYGEVVDVRLRGIDESSSLRWEAINVKPVQ